MAHFSHEEYADIHYVYGLCDGNALAARTEYQRRFPSRRIPDARVFSNTHRRLRETGTTTASRIDRHPEAASDVELDNEILRIVRRNPSISIRRLSLQLNVSRRKISKVLHAEKLHPYHSTPVQELLPQDLPARLEFCHWLLERTFDDHRFIENILWTDESQFTRDGVTNFHNLHTWAPENPHLKKQTSFQHRFSVNVWAGVIGDKLIGPCILPPTLNSENYLEFLQNEMPTLLEDIPLLQRSRLIYQHDGAPSHCGVIVKDWMNEIYPNRWIGRNGAIHWPARSPDLTVMDFYVWGTMKELVYAKEIATLDELKERIEEAAEKVRAALPTINICRSIQKRALACIQSEGNHFEHLL